MTKKIFITATDTDAGKTHIACAIVNALVRSDKKVSVYKPISAGCENVDGKLINEDAQRLLQQSNTGQSIERVNPIAFEPPIAPHIAAKKLNCSIEISELQTNFDSLIDEAPDVLITEGAGGWRLPLGNGKFLSEFAAITNQSVVLIVNMKLGCLNHALLTYEAIMNDGLTCIGWIANGIEEMPYFEENLATLKEQIPAPNLGVVRFEPDISKIADIIDISNF